MKFQVLLGSSDAPKIAHLAKNYITDEQFYEGKFFKTIVANRDLVLRVDRHTSKDLVQIKKNELTTHVDVGSFRSGKKIEVKILKGERATLTFPA